MAENIERSAESEPWWPEFVSLYKKVPLRELARRFQTNPRRLRRAAQRTGLDDEPPVIAENEARLGTVPDPTLAEQLGVTPEIVKGARTRRNIPAYDPRTPKPKSSRRSTRKAPAPKPAKPPRVRPDPMLVEVFRRGSSPPTPAAAPPVVERAPLKPPRAEPARPPEAERRWRTEDRSWGEPRPAEPRPAEAEERRRRLPRADEGGERRRIVQSSPRTGEGIIRRVSDGGRTSREPAPPRRDNDDFEDYASRRIRESGRRLAETMEELEPDVQPRIAPDSARPRRRIVAAERLEELREGPERPAAPEPEPTPPKRKRARSTAPPVRTLFVREQGGTLPEELLRDLPVFPEPRPALLPPHIPAPPPVEPAPVVVAPLRFWQAILSEGGPLIIAAPDLAAAALLLASRGPVLRLEPAALLA